MKKLEITFQYNGTTYNKEAIINDDINENEILADHPKNKDVSAEFGMIELGVWSLNFTEPYMTIECDFLSKFDDNIETLTLCPVEVLLWSNGGTCINNDKIKFKTNITDL